MPFIENIVFLAYPQNYTITFSTTEFFIRYNLLVMSNSCTCEKFYTKPAHMYTIKMLPQTFELQNLTFVVYKSLCA